MENRPEWRMAFRTAVSIHAAVVAAVFLYAIVIEVLRAVLKPLPKLAAGLNPQTLRYVFYGLAVVAVISVRQANKGMLKAVEGEPLREFLHRLSRISILTSILCEVPAGLGVVLVLLVGSFRDFYYLLFVSLFLAFMYFPRSRNWAQTLRERFPEEGV